MPGKSPDNEKVVRIVEFSKCQSIPEVEVCRHTNLVFSERARQIFCHDCGDEIDHFDAFITMASSLSVMYEEDESRKKQLKALEKEKVETLAGKAFERAFKKKNSVPGCPHCKQPIFPEDVVSDRGIIEISKVIADRIREKK